MKYATIVALLATTASAELIICESADECDEGACCGYAYDEELIERVCSEADEVSPDVQELEDEGYTGVVFSCEEPESEKEEGASRLAFVSAAALGLLYMA